MTSKRATGFFFLWFNVNVNEEQLFKMQLRSLQIGGIADVYYTLGCRCNPAILFLFIGGKLCITQIIMDITRMGDI